MRANVPELLSIEEIEKLPAQIVEKLKAESITSMGIAPMVTATGLLGAITMGSRRPNNFGQEDLDLLSQISNQIALAVDNAIAYGRVTQAKARLEEERLYLESEISFEYNFEDIVGKSAALRKVLGSDWRRRPHATQLCSCTARPALVKNSLPGRFIIAARVVSALSSD